MDDQNETPEIDPGDVVDAESMHAKERETFIKLPKDYDIEFQKWMIGNNYSLLSIRKYHPFIMKLTWEDKLVSRSRFKEFLRTNVSAATKRAAVKLFIIFLDDFYGIEIPPFRFPRIPLKYNPLETVSKEDIDLVISHLSPFCRMFAILLYYGGLRVSEVAKMNTEDFDWSSWMKNKEDYGSLRIIKGKKQKDRIVPIPAPVMQEVFDFADKTPEGYLQKGKLMNYFCSSTRKGTHRDYYFYLKRRMRKKQVSIEEADRSYTRKVIRYFQKELRRVSMEVLKKPIKTHMLRASRATHLDEKGMPPSSIQYMLGHESLSTTSRYIVNTPEKLKKNIKKYDIN